MSQTPSDVFRGLWPSVSGENGGVFELMLMNLTELDLFCSSGIFLTNSLGLLSAINCVCIALGTDVSGVPNETRVTGISPSSDGFVIVSILRSSTAAILPVVTVVVVGCGTAADSGCTCACSWLGFVGVLKTLFLFGVETGVFRPESCCGVVVSSFSLSLLSFCFSSSRWLLLSVVFLDEPELAIF